VLSDGPHSREMPFVIRDWLEEHLDEHIHAQLVSRALQYILLNQTGKRFDGRKLGQVGDKRELITIVRVQPSGFSDGLCDWSMLCKSLGLTRQPLMTLQTSNNLLLLDRCQCFLCETDRRI